MSASQRQGRGVYRLTEQGQQRGALIEALTLTLADSKQSVDRPDVAAGCVAAGGIAFGTV